MLEIARLEDRREHADVELLRFLSEQHPAVARAQRLDLDRATQAGGRAGAGTGWATHWSWTGPIWLEREPLVAKGYVYEDHTGWYVSASGGWPALGSPGVVCTNGCAYLHSHTTPGWVEHVQLRPTDAQLGAAVGQSVVLRDPRMAVGARLADAPYPNTGADSVYDIQAQNPQPTYYCLRRTQAGLRGLPTAHLPHRTAQLLIRRTERRELLSPGLKGPAPCPGDAATQHGGSSLPALRWRPALLVCPDPHDPGQADDVHRLRPSPVTGRSSVDSNAWIASDRDPALIPGQPV